MKGILTRLFFLIFFGLVQIMAFSQATDGCEFYSNTLKIHTLSLPIVSISGTSPLKLGKSTKLVAHMHTAGKKSFLWSTGDTASLIKVTPNATTTYTLTVTNLAGCTNTALFTVQVVPNQSVAKILNFKAYRKGLISKLDWISNTGELNDYFIVERSADSLHFSPMLKMDGRGIPEINLFFTENDNHPFEVNFYRLILVGLDGSKTYSQVEKVVFPPLSEISIFPNPTSDQFFVNLTPLEGKLVSMQLINVDSRLIENFEVVASRNLFEIQTFDLPSGMYFLKIETVGHRPKVLKVVVAR